MSRAPRVLGKVAILFVMAGCAESEPAPGRPVSASKEGAATRPAASRPEAYAEAKPPSVQANQASVPIVVSGPGLSRPLPLDQITNVFLNVQLDESYTGLHGLPNESHLASPFMEALSRQVTEQGLMGPVMPPNSSGCGGCTAAGWIDLRITKPSPEVYQITAEFRAPTGARTWVLRRSEKNPNLTLVQQQGSRHSDIFGSIQNDLRMIGAEVCRTLTASDCKEL